MNILQWLGSLELGLIYALVAIGVYISFKVIDFPDLTVDGSFTLGAAVATVLITFDLSPLLATLLALTSGALAGIMTGYLHVRWHILGLLAGILTMTALYSINLRIMGKPNIALIDELTVFTDHSIIGVTLIAVSITLALLIWLFSTPFGLKIRATGINPKVSSAYGIQIGKNKIVALAMSNGVVALSGALFAQSQGFADISMGSGTIIIGLASIIIAQTLFNPQKIAFALISCLIGSILYRIAIAFALNSHGFGLQGSDLNLITALIVAMTIVLPKIRLTTKQGKI